ncbi:hypothetical protein [Chitinophaga pollutisoli]|uniref:hypothetical protein n=1 Tax=Chitinophaga pollutisoli TaxID=3133966 RepID=UPI003857711E
MLGEAGATVYCTGRSVRGALASGPQRPETIEETAEIVTQLGGAGIPVQTDHSKEADVIALMDRIRADHGHLDVLVNDVWGGDALMQWGQPFWENDLSKGFQMMRQAIDTHIITAKYAVPLMLPKNKDLSSKSPTEMAISTADSSSTIWSKQQSFAWHTIWRRIWSPTTSAPSPSPPVSSAQKPCSSTSVSPRTTGKTAPPSILTLSPRKHPGLLAAPLPPSPPILTFSKKEVKSSVPGTSPMNMDLPTKTVPARIGATTSKQPSRNICTNRSMTNSIATGN